VHHRSVLHVVPWRSAEPGWLVLHLMREEIGTPDLSLDMVVQQGLMSFFHRRRCELNEVKA
jgi:hypothetical protein